MKNGLITETTTITPTERTVSVTVSFPVFVKRIWKAVNLSNMSLEQYEKVYKNELDELFNSMILVEMFGRRN